MRKLFLIGSALLASAAFASTAEARMGGMSMPSSMSHGGGARSTSPSMGSPRTFDAGAVATRAKGSNWKHPIDSDNGGPGDPPNKPPKGSTQTGSNEDPSQGWTHRHPDYSGKGYWDRWGHHHGPWPASKGTGDSGPPLACRGRIGGC